MDKVLWAIFSIVIGFVVWTFVSGNNALSINSYLVQSGSMEPSIGVGDVIFVQPQNNYSVNDVVTFIDDQGRKVTHRIVEIERSGGEMMFATKGDANKDDDRSTLDQSQIIGKVMITIPKMGYLVNFTKTPTGFILFIIVPAIWILAGEVRSLASAARANSY